MVNKAILAIFVLPAVMTKDNAKHTVIQDGFQNLEALQKGLVKGKSHH